MTNYDKFAHKIGQSISNDIFDLTIEEKAIFYALASNGPKLLTELGNIVKNYGEWEANRWAIKRRIKGTRNISGLIEQECIIEKVHETRIRGKDGKYFCLTTKGLLASLSTGIQLEKTYLFKKYIEFIKNRLDQNYQSRPQLDGKTKKYLIDLVTQHIKNSIFLFLIWHDAHGINLKNKTSINWYFVEFFKNANKYIYQKFPQVKNKETEYQYKTIIQEYVVSLQILSGIKPPKNKLITKVSDSTEHHIAMIIPFALEWYRFFDRLQLISPVGKPYINIAPSFVIKNPNLGISIGNNDSTGIPMQERIKKDIAKILKKQIRHKIPNYTKGTTIHRYKESDK